MGHPLSAGKGVSNGVKKAMVLVRMIGRRNGYSQKRRTLNVAMKQIRVIRRKLRVLVKQLKKLRFTAAHDSLVICLFIHQCARMVLCGLCMLIDDVF